MAIADTHARVSSAVSHEEPQTDDRSISGFWHFAFMVRKDGPCSEGEAGRSR